MSWTTKTPRGKAEHKQESEHCFRLGNDSDLAVGAESRLETCEALSSGSGSRTIVGRYNGAIRQRDWGDLVCPEAILYVGNSALLATSGELIHLLPADILNLAHVLSRLAHRDVHVRQTLLRCPRILPALGTSRSALTRTREDCIRRGVTGACTVTRHGLHTCGDEAVTLTGLDGVCRHTDRLQRR